MRLFKQDLRMIREIIDVPFPLACSSRLMSFFTFHISMFFSASLACGALMLSKGIQFLDQTAGGSKASLIEDGRNFQ